MATVAKARAGAPLALNGSERALGYGSAEFLFVTVLAIPALVWNARTHQVRHHRRIVRNLTVGEQTLARILWGVRGGGGPG